MQIDKTAECEVLKSEIVKLNIEIEKIKNELNEYKSADYQTIISNNKSLIGELKDKNKKYIEELNQLTKEYFLKDEQIKELSENLFKVKNENIDSMNLKHKEMSHLQGKLSELTEEKEVLLE